MIVFGGQNGGGSGGVYTDTWVLTNANGLGGAPAWVQLSPSGGPPPDGYFASHVYDESNNRMMVYGGSDGTSGVNPVWVLSAANGLGGTPAWTNLIANGTSGSPVPTYNSPAVFDPATNEMLLFNDYNGTSSGDRTTWVLSGSNGLSATSWRELLAVSSAVPGTPPQNGAGFDPTNRRMITFTNSLNAASTNEVWELSPGCN
jgi:hypothetical protein